MLSLSSQDGTTKIPNLIKWAGGKNNLVETLMNYVPQEFGTYYEPFFGGGSLYWNLKLMRRIDRAVISDLNPELINLLSVVRDRFEDLHDELRNYADLQGSDDYYRIRSLFNFLKNEPDTSTESAAMFLYLNRNSYNGLWRTNRKGEFNVPYGFYTRYWLPSLDDLIVYSHLLQGTKILNTDFSNAIKECRQGDFVYFDPPYFNERDYGFTKYCSVDFTVSEQKRLKENVDCLALERVFVIESNYSTDFIQRLYENYRRIEVEVHHPISCKKSSRKDFRELMITNY